MRRTDRDIEGQRKEGGKMVGKRGRNEGRKQRKKEERKKGREGGVGEPIL